MRLPTCFGLIIFLISTFMGTTIHANDKTNVTTTCYPSGTVIIVLDFSESTRKRDDIEKLQFVKMFAQWANPYLGEKKLDVSVIGFSASADRGAFKIVNRNTKSAQDIMEQYVKKYRTLEKDHKLGGMTYMDAGLYLAEDLMKFSKKKKVVIAISDGAMSIHGDQKKQLRYIRKYEETAEEFRNKRILLFSIIIKNVNWAPKSTKFMKMMAYNSTYFAKLDDLDIRKQATKDVLKSLYRTVCVHTYSAMHDPRMIKRIAAAREKNRKRVTFILFPIILAIMIVACLWLAAVALWAKRKKEKATAVGGAGGEGAYYSESVWNDLTTTMAQGGGTQVLGADAGITANNPTTHKARTAGSARPGKDMGVYNTPYPSLGRNTASAKPKVDAQGQQADRYATAPMESVEDLGEDRTIGVGAASTTGYGQHTGSAKPDAKSKGHDAKTSTCRSPGKVQGQSNRKQQDMTKGEQANMQATSGIKDKTAGNRGAGVTKGQQVSQMQPTSKQRTAETHPADKSHGQQASMAPTRHRDKTAGARPADKTQGQQVTNLPYSTKDKTAGTRHEDKTQGQQVTNLPYSTQDKTAGTRRADKTQSQQVTALPQTAKDKTAGVRQPDVSRGQAVTKASTTRKTER